jgi:hypothetical protein
MGCNTVLDDDDSGTLTLPFALTFYDTSSNVISPSTNGLLSLSQGTSSYSNSPLPATFSDTLVQAVAFPLWTDLAINAGTDQGIYYFSNSSYVMLEWVLAASCCPSLLAQFSMAYDDVNAPGVVTFR